MNGLQDIVVAVTQADLDKLRKAFGAKDDVGVAQLVISGAAFLVSNDSPVLVLDKQGFLVQAWEIRILDGPMKNRVAWTEPEWIIR